jgi:plasmid maintenance system antidote protein VapI
MEAEGLTNSKFASILGIQRSNVTHIIDGRNKPSLSFIEKLIAKFPYVNIEWLITGNGEMYKQNEISEQKSKQQTVNSPTLFPEIDVMQTTDNQTNQISNAQLKDLNTQQVQEPELESKSEQIVEQKSESEQTEIETKEEIESIEKTEKIIESELEIKTETKKEAPSFQNTEDNKSIENEREIECVLIFHSDKTFKYYKPV